MTATARTKISTLLSLSKLNPDLAKLENLTLKLVSVFLASLATIYSVLLLERQTVKSVIRMPYATEKTGWRRRMNTIELVNNRVSSMSASVLSLASRVTRRIQSVFALKGIKG